MAPSSYYPELTCSRMSKMISIILPVYNHDWMIDKVLNGIWANSTDMVKEVLIIIDGCTDRSEIVVTEWLRDNAHKRNIEPKIAHAPNVFEVKACNMGLKWATQPFCCSVQDDMVIDIPNWDENLLRPFYAWNDVWAVTALAAVDLGLEEDGRHLMWYNATNSHNSDPNQFSVRDTVNRGPLMMRSDVLKDLNYLDEVFAPLGMDDMDICMRAYAKGKWVCGVMPMHAFFRNEDGTTRRTSGNVQSWSWNKNMPILVNRHRAAIVGPKHSENRRLG